MPEAPNKFSFENTSMCWWSIPVSSNLIKATDWVFHTGGICHVWCNFEPGYTCRTTIIFETVKGNRLKINSLPTKYGCSYNNVLQNGVNSLSKNVFKKLGFLPKTSKFCTFWIIRFGSNFACMWSKYVSNNAQRDFIIPVSAYATVARQSFNGKFPAKIGF